MSKTPDQTGTTGRPPIPVPQGGFRSNADEARWLADTIEMRAEDAFAALGLNVSSKSKNDSLYTLILMSLDSASKRGRAEVSGT